MRNASAPSEAQRNELAELVLGFAPAPGRYETPWPGLRCFHAVRPTDFEPVVYEPSLCVVAQGAKEARTGIDVFRYDELHFLVVAAQMPARARILEATEKRPFLSLAVTIEMTELREILIELAAEGQQQRSPATAMLCVSRLDTRLTDALLRLLRSVTNSAERRILGRAAKREILYLLLQSDQGGLLRLLIDGENRISGIGRVLQYINRHMHESFDVPTLARSAGMSASSLHHLFKKATSLTPVQYVKRVRLDEARRLMVDEGCHAAEAAFRVGYGSPSQFSKEFKRLFGLPPREYVGATEPARRPAE